MRPRADGQRQGQIKEPEATSAPLRMMSFGSVGGPAIREGSGRAGNGCGKADTLTTGMKSGSVLTRADGGVRAQESSVKSAAARLIPDTPGGLHGRIGKGLTMRFGNWRGVPLALSLAAMLGWGLATSVRADGWHLQYTIPREVPAYDYSTGGEYYAPPVPYGHYAKNDAGKAMGYVSGCFMDLWDKTVGLFHHCGDGCGLCHGCGHGSGGKPGGLGTIAAASGAAAAAGSWWKRLRLLRRAGAVPSWRWRSRRGLRGEFRDRGAGWGLPHRFGAGSEEAFSPLPCLDRDGGQPGSTGHRLPFRPLSNRIAAIRAARSGPSFALGPPPMPVLRRIGLRRLRRSRNW